MRKIGSGNWGHKGNPKAGTIRAIWTMSIGTLPAARPRVYVAGPYSPINNSPTSMLDHMRRGIRAGTELLMAGFTPFVPFFDFLLWMTLRKGEEITKEQIQAYSLNWLEACEAIRLLPGWRKSTGTMQELKEADRLGIPYFTSMAALKKHFAEKKASAKRRKSNRS